MRVIYQFLFVAAATAASGAFISAAAQEVKDKGPETVTLEGPRGTVTFKHAEHQKKTECISCHHASKEQKPLTKEQQACRDCHTKPPTEPVTTSLRDAFHDATAKNGTCLTCHQKEAAAGKDVPTKCSGCHVKPEGE